MGEACCAGDVCNAPETVCDEGTCTGCIERVVGGSNAGGGCVETKAGKQICWGMNDDDQIVCGGLNAYLPREIDHLGAARVDSMGSHVCAITTDGKAYCWGYNGSGEVGLDPAVAGNGVCPGNTISLPAQITQLSTGSSSTLALQSDGAVYGWGSNDYGQLFIDETFDAVDHFTPVSMAWAPPSSKVLSLTLSSCVLTLDERVVCVGSNQNYRLGTTEAVGYPARVEVDLEGVKELEGIGGTVCTRNGLGEVWCWGSNGYDQIAPNLPAELGPTRVVLPAAAKRISVGNGHTCAILIDDSVYCWGSNQGKALAACDLGQYPGPQYVYLDAAKTQKLYAKDLAMGYGHGCATDLNDQLWCWGTNAFFNAAVDNGFQPVCPPQRISIACE
jgi:alpha-tubulin suppressor-like RCC1 family protein